MQIEMTESTSGAHAQSQVDCSERVPNREPRIHALKMAELSKGKMVEILKVGLSGRSSIDVCLGHDQLSSNNFHCRIDRH